MANIVAQWAGTLLFTLILSKNMFGSFHFRNFLFPHFGHFSRVIIFKFVSVLNFCLAHLALLSKNVNKHDYVIFLYNCTIVDQNEKQKMGTVQWCILSIFCLVYFYWSSHNIHSCKFFHRVFHQFKLTSKADKTLWVLYQNRRKLSSVAWSKIYKTQHFGAVQWF